MEYRISEQCVHCGLCTRNCLFLEKYHMDLAELEARPELAYSCFMCGKCKAVCPKDIDGVKIALEARKVQIQAGAGAVADKSYQGMLLEKSPYKFANYRKGKKKSVLFPGCNFMSFFPKTMKCLEELMKKHDIGIVYECCGKPVYELGMEQRVTETLKKMETRLLHMGVEELIMICPNCYYFLKDKIEIPMVTIYEKLTEMGEGKKIEKALPLYIPCPDRSERIIYHDMRPFMDEVTEPFEKVQCCGLGGCAAAKEPELSAKMAGQAKTYGGEMYTYCASCVSSFKRKGYSNVQHILPVILGVEEDVPLGIQPFINRAKKIL